MEGKKRGLRWAGMAGLVAGILFVLGFGILLAFVPPLPGDPEGLVMRFPDVRAALMTAQNLAMVAALLSVALFLVLYQALRGTGRGPALFGSVLTVLGLVVLAIAVASTFAAFAPLSDLYHAPGATPEEQATVVLLWQATQSITDTFFFVANVFLMIGFIALGVAMLGDPAFGKGFGGVSVVLGAAGALQTYATLAVPGTFVVGHIATLIFVLLFGWKVYSLSRPA